MNWVLFFVLSAFAWNLVWGFSKGFLRVVFSMTAWILLLVFVTLAMPAVSKAVTEHTAIDEKIEEACEKALLSTDDAAGRLLAESGVFDRISAQAGAFAVKGIAYIAVFVTAFLAFHAINMALDLVSRLPLIGEVNHLLGLLAGAVKGMLVVWLVFAFIALICATSRGAALVSTIYESELLICLYENNPILNILLIFL